MPLLQYAVQSCCYAAVLWLVYCLVWRGRLWHRGSRAFLLLSMALPLVLPLLRLSEAAMRVVPGYGATLPNIRLGATLSSPASPVDWSGVFMLVYVAGCVVLGLLYTVAYVRLYRALKGGKARRYAAYTLITGAGIGPGSIGRIIFFPGEAIHPTMLRHEEAHILAGHRFDTALLQLFRVLCWVSPAHWMLGRELKAVHEFEADQLASVGLDRSEYAALILSETMRLPQNTPAAHFFFHHPFKRRITMLQKSTPARRPAMLLATLVLTSMLSGAALLAQTKKAGKPMPRQSAQTTTSINELLQNEAPNGAVSLLNDGSVVFRKVDKMPVFVGGIYPWLNKNLHYQDMSEAKMVQQSCVVQFTIAEDGTVLHPQVVQSCGSARLDAEAVRAIGAMPAWKPGLQNGKPVSVLMVQSIGFGGDGISGC